jgi:hypothetical protein
VLGKANVDELLRTGEVRADTTVVSANVNYPLTLGCWPRRWDDQPCGGSRTRVARHGPCSAIAPEPRADDAGPYGRDGCAGRVCGVRADPDIHADAATGHQPGPATGRRGTTPAGGLPERVARARTLALRASLSFNVRVVDGHPGRSWIRPLGDHASC